LRKRNEFKRALKPCEQEQFAAMRSHIAAAVLLLCVAVVASVLSFRGNDQHEPTLQSSMSLLQQRASLRTARLQQLASVIPGLVRCSGFVSCPLGFKIPENFKLNGEFGGDALTIVDNPDDSFLDVHGMNNPSNDIGYATAPVANVIRLATKREAHADAFDSHLKSQVDGTDRSPAQLAAASPAAAAPKSDDDDTDVTSQFNAFAASVLDSEEAAASAQKELNEEGWEDEPVAAQARGAQAPHEQLDTAAGSGPLEEGHLERQRRLFARGLSHSMARMLRRKAPRR
jgi:hypothetical protein